ncbi:hypothetical protein [Streptomyces pluripotens]|uniref:hypothetical protein n=1 Tax=Streptomyces pluripotens TaxID=1355015 RepID=UPI000AE2B88E|nr:hypothetical protein [Streptomyces pluripotens]
MIVYTTSRDVPRTGARARYLGAFTTRYKYFSRGVVKACEEVFAVLGASLGEHCARS